MLSVETIIVVMNEGSGHDDKAQAEAAIRAELEGCGRPWELLRVAPAEIAAKLTEAFARHPVPGVVVAAGGDGTLNLVAEAALHAGWTLGVVPLGTFNYFARDLGLPQEPAAAMRAVLSGRMRRVHAARINGHLFLNNASFGLYRQLLERREQMKRRLGRYRIVALLAALTTLWRFDRSYRLEVDIDGRRERLRTPLLFFGLNSLQLERLELAAAACMAEGRLAVIAPRTSSRLKLFWLAVQGALRRLEGAPSLDCRCASQVRVEWPGHAQARIAVDGEALQCRLPLQVEVMPAVLPVRVPLEPEPRA